MPLAPIKITGQTVRKATKFTFTLFLERNRKNVSLASNHLILACHNHFKKHNFFARCVKKYGHAKMSPDPDYPVAGYPAQQ